MPLHPDALALLERRAALGLKLSSVPPQEARLVSAQRRAAIKAPAGAPAGVVVEDVQVSRADGAVRVRAYRPPGREPLCRIVYLHGGGWVLGEVESLDFLCGTLAAVTGSEVLNVEYRLAPENPFPAALEDSMAVLEWASAAPGPAPLVVAGDSAGANLAAAAAILARDRGGPAIDLQVLSYPIMDHDFGSGSYREHGDNPLIMNRADMEYFWGHYVPDPARRGDFLVSPLRCSDLRGLPPAVMLIAEFDPLRDEGLAYAERLREAGVDVALKYYDDMAHGFLSMAPTLAAATQAIEDLGSRIVSHVLRKSSGADGKAAAQGAD